VRITALAAETGSKNRLANLDLLRLLAAVMVVFYHYTYSGHATGSWNPIAYPELSPMTQHFWSGVSLFFIISGFVIAYSAQNRSAFDFLTSRVARLYPAFIVCMSMTALGMVLFAPSGIVEFAMTFQRWLANLVMFSPALKQPFVDAAYWSIIIEIIFYLWVTGLIAIGLFQKRQLEIMVIWLAISFGNEFLLESTALKHLFTTRFAGYFVLGILTYRVFASNRMPSFSEISIAALALVLCVKSDHQMLIWMQTHYTHAPEWSAVSAILKTIGMLATINIAIRINPLLRTAWCTMLGGLTYPLYLIHQNLGFVMFHKAEGAMNRWLLLSLILIVMVTVAWLVYRFIEPSGRKFIINIGAAIKARAPVLAAAPAQ
jgi:peptidoglycan/LPS O-acetylase OafA/YrhL